MDRRGFLKLISASALFSLGSRSQIATAADGRFVSATLGFKFRIPTDWNLYTVADDIDAQFAEWGGLDPNYEPPIVLLQRFREPTTVQNYQMQIYACDQIEAATLSAGDRRMALNWLYEILVETNPTTSQLRELPGDSTLPFDTFSASFKTRGTNHEQSFHGCAHLWYGREFPLIVITCMPNNGDRELLHQVVRTIENT